MLFSACRLEPQSQSLHPPPSDTQPGPCSCLPSALQDAFRAQHPTATGWFSYWSTRAGNRPFNGGLRLDYTAVSARLIGTGAQLRVADAFIDDEGTLGTSDHGPVGIVLTGL